MLKGKALITNCQLAIVEKIPLPDGKKINGFASPPELHLVIVVENSGMDINQLNQNLYDLFMQREIEFIFK